MLLLKASCLVLSEGIVGLVEREEGWLGARSDYGLFPWLLQRQKVGESGFSLLPRLRNGEYYRGGLRG